MPDISDVDVFNSNSTVKPRFEKTIRNSSPFYSWARNIYLQIEEAEITCKKDCLVDINTFQCIPLAERFLNSLCAYLPLFTGLLIFPKRYDQRLSFAEKNKWELKANSHNLSVGCVERWMRIVKEDVCNSQHMDLVTFLKTLNIAVCGRHRLFLQSLTTLEDNDLAINVEHSKTQNNIMYQSVDLDSPDSISSSPKRAENSAFEFIKSLLIETKKENVVSKTVIIFLFSLFTFKLIFF